MLINSRIILNRLVEGGLTYRANVVSFVEVEPALHANDQHLVDVADDELSGVSLDGGAREAGDVFVRYCHRIAHGLCHLP